MIKSLRDAILESWEIFEIFPAYEQNAIRVDIFDNKLESIVTFNPITGEEI